MLARTLLLAALAGLAQAPFLHAADEPTYRDRWIYSMFNLQVEKNADELIRVMDRAGKAGYTGVVLADYKLNILDRVPPHYFKNLARVQAAAKKSGLEIIPAVFPVGYSSGLLAHDPHLAEGLPVKAAPFVVRKGVAVPASDPPARLANPGLEETRGDRFTGYSFQDDPGTKTFADRETTHGGKVSCRMEGFTGGNARLVQRVKLRPYACYRFSAWVKTKDLQPAGNFKLLALGVKGRQLSFAEGERKPTEDWNEVAIVFNTAEESEVNLYAGVWTGRSGKLWIDDLRLEELSLVNVLRRPGCPLVVASGDGKTEYEEGKDFEPVKDEKLGNVPYAGEYSFRHSGAEARLTKTSRIKEGDRLRISWYHPVQTHSFQVMCCLSEPRLYEVLAEQARLVQKHLAPRTWFFSHDEIRVAGWCQSCREGGKTPGELLAANVGKCVDIVRKLDPKARVVVWSDMFDPNHNAVDRYYLVNGSLKGSWLGLPRDVDVANWNGGKAAASLKWFAQRGHGQVIAGYYDSGTGNFRRWHEAAKGVQGVTGFMYTTWRGDYSQLEAFGRLMRGKE